MINGNELRIGNCLYYNGKVIRVAAFDPTKQYEDLTGSISFLSFFTNGKFMQYNHKWFNDFEPILLTEYILMKCGFVDLHHLGRRQPTIKINDGEINFVFDNKKPICTLVIEEENIDENINIGLFVVNNILFHIQYLHNLQNLYYSLTGEELKTKL